MKNLAFIFSLTFVLILGSCSSSKTTAYNRNLSKEIAEKNNKTIPLLDRVRRLPGITLRGGIPYFMKSANQISGTATEPLYVLNGFIMGNSFKSLNQLVDSATIKSIDALSGSEAASYGSRAASGVIKITTYQ